MHDCLSSDCLRNWFRRQWIAVLLYLFGYDRASGHHSLFSYRHAAYMCLSLYSLVFLMPCSGTSFLEASRLLVLRTCAFLRGSLLLICCHCLTSRPHKCWMTHRWLCTLCCELSHSPGDSFWLRVPFITFGSFPLMSLPWNRFVPKYNMSWRMPR